MAEAVPKPEEDGCFDRLWAQRSTKTAQTLLKCLSLTSGLFLLVAGIVGLSAIFFLQIIYFIGSFYTIFFGLLVLTLELRDRLPLISAAYSWIGIYLKFLTLQRGKGAFYWGVGLMVLFISPDNTSKWGLNNVAALVLAFVGFLHTFMIIKDPDPALSPGDSEFREVTPMPTATFSGNISIDSGRANWTDMVNHAK
uniref:Uncharacterized protein n=1 Tax=Chrysotila carterae TaxID=13221 RepID=A0A6T0BU72_CHRCT|mmetsp:Transcript_25467/g.55702  ORF Transcript_25467/g.55702 Transcript_25467/m.55702 type:complete len:196 (+) Transcript_25467:349-936(+)